MHTSPPHLATPSPANWVRNVSKAERSLKLFDSNWIKEHKGLYADKALINGVMVADSEYYGLYDLELKKQL